MKAITILQPWASLMRRQTDRNTVMAKIFSVKVRSDRSYDSFSNWKTL
jgi:hypothetical protein